MLWLQVWLLHSFSVLNSHPCVTHILTSFSEHLSNCNTTRAFLQQGSATSYNTNKFRHYLESVYCHRVKRILLTSWIAISKPVWQIFTCGACQRVKCIIIILSLKRIWEDQQKFRISAFSFNGSTSNHNERVCDIRCVCVCEVRATISSTCCKYGE